MKSQVQIYGNPDDLSICLGKMKDKPGKWGMVISRGPRDGRHAFYPIFSTSEEAEFTKEQAIEQVREVLKASMAVGEKAIFSDHSHGEPSVAGIFQIIFNRNKLSKEEYTKKIAPVLTEEDIEKIIQFVKRKECAETYRWKNYWEKRFPGWKKLQQKALAG